jgi:hypothetical protein
MKPVLLILSAIGICMGRLSLPAQTYDAIQFPKEFRTWACVKTVLIGPQSPAFATEAGIHHIYANGKALEGYETGKFPDGSVVVYELLETKETEGRTTEGPTRRIDVMAKQSELYSATGGWGFMSFPGGDPNSAKLAAERQASCFACHGKRKDHDSVFSEFRK